MKLKRTRLWWDRNRVLPVLIGTLLGLSLWTVAVIGIGYAVLM